MSTSSLNHACIAAVIGSLCATVALAGEIDVAWIDRFNGENNGQIEDDYGQAIAIDASGNVFITGFSFEQVQSDLYSPRYVTIKYNPAGDREWVRFYRNGNFDSAAYVNGVDSQGNLVASGEFFLGQDWATLKYDADGNVQWTTIYQADSTFVSNPEAMVIDGNDNVYITGDVGSAINPDFGALVKYNAAGAQQWVAEYYGPESDGGGSDAIAVDDEGNVYLVGYAVVSGLASEAALVKYNSTGTLLWQRTDGSRFASAHDGFHDVTIDHDGNIVVAGTFARNTAAGPDVAVSKYDPQGTLIWSREYDGGVGSDYGVAVEIDSGNNIVIAGYSEVGPSDYDSLLLKYDADGALLWNVTEGGDASGLDLPRDLKLDPADNIYFAGTEQPFVGADFYITASYTPQGVRRWKETYGGPDQGGSDAIVLGVGPAGSVYVSGNSVTPGNDFDIATIKYVQPSSGTPAELTRFAIVTGSLLDGGLLDLGASDDAYVHTRSGFGSTFVDLHHMEMMVTAMTANGSPALIDLAIEDRIDQPAGTSQVRLRNWNTGQFVLVNSHAVGTSDNVVSIPDLDASVYVNASGEIDVSIKHIVFVPFLAFTFESFVDHVEIEVR